MFISWTIFHRSGFPKEKLRFTCRELLEVAFNSNACKGETEVGLVKEDAETRCGSNRSLS